jgi:hypothetical protein
MVLAATGGFRRPHHPALSALEHFTGRASALLAVPRAGRVRRWPGGGRGGRVLGGPDRRRPGRGGPRQPGDTGSAALQVAAAAGTRPALVADPLGPRCRVDRALAGPRHLRRRRRPLTRRLRSGNPDRRPMFNRLDDDGVPGVSLSSRAGRRSPGMTPWSGELCAPLVHPRSWPIGAALSHGEKLVAEARRSSYPAA